jgi:type II secretory pathway pseudopilin PulG
MHQRSRERGYLLLVIIFMVALVAVALAAIAPAIGTQIKRDREEELVHRANQYVRAIQLYYRKFGSYPISIDQLENTNNLRFLRKKYTDPITGKDEWKLIRFGQAHPKKRPAWMAGATGVGAPAAGMGSGTPQSGFSNASDISKPLSGSPTLGTGPIVGVASTSDKEGLKEIDGKTKYSDWEFTYDPTLDTTFRGQQPQGQPGGTGGGLRPGGPSPQPQTGTSKPN